MALDAMIPREEMKGFLQALAQTTGLAMAFLPPASFDPNLAVGETSFCLTVKSTQEGDGRCRRSIAAVVKAARGSGQPEFRTCHAGLGTLAVPLVMNGRDMGVVLVSQSLPDAPEEGFWEGLERLAADAGIARGDRLEESVAANPVFPAARLKVLGGFIQEQLFEKMAARDILEDTTEYLLEKYEELMLLYSITENVAPGSDYSEALSVILEKGAQKLKAAWGAFLVTADNEGAELDVLKTTGRVPWSPIDRRLPEPVLTLTKRCRGPIMASSDGAVLGPAGAGDDVLLVSPFRMKSDRRGYLIFGAEGRELFGDSELRLILALSSQAASIIHTLQLNREMADLLFATLGALASAIDVKDPYTHGHSQRVADYAVMTARHMGFEPKFLTMLKIAGQLHDFGKIGVREHILAKDGNLDEHEQLVMNEHPMVGAQILDRFKPFAEIVPGIRHHHERFDGQGYPDGLAGEAIPMVGRIIAVADAFDAMTTTRPYRTRLDLTEALTELRGHAGTQFDPAVVEAFIQAFNRRRADE